MRQEILNIISIYFDEKNVFELEFGGSKKIRQEIDRFIQQKGDWIDRFFYTELRAKFSDFKFDAYLHKLYGDRCISIYVTKETGLHVEHYMIGISIFGYFMVFRQDYNKIEKSKDDLDYHPDLPVRSIFEDRVFLNEGENPFADEVFSITKRFYPELMWLPKDILTTTIRSLNIFSNRIPEERIIYELLFISN
ncbi:hypothetical protein ACI6Q2_18515 [Chitinophagaceae bacterium LWZ2-11]